MPLEHISPGLGFCGSGVGEACELPHGTVRTIGSNSDTAFIHRPGKRRSVYTRERRESGLFPRPASPLKGVTETTDGSTAAWVRPETVGRSLPPRPVHTHGRTLQTWAQRPSNADVGYDERTHTDQR
ncbi:hypothetical protein AAFF_G00389000 [Aldrovandia affinis]|uniref:Uncharacterized protein n=1 Tax=Aldrovandia affinis TaxID=143900 RepID=A0AAD7SEC7_9TELE|nr:hypothetical protein AAFF_G00389000 [Aldrovandia affinis]